MTLEQSAPPPTAVILPTLWSGPWVWRQQIPVIAAIAPNVVEIPGAVVNWPIEATLDAVEAYCLQKIDPLPGPLLLVGASIGGLIALRIAAHRPDIVSAVVASGCPGLGPGSDFGLRGKFAVTEDDLRRIRALLFNDTSCVGDALVRATVAGIANRPAARKGAALLRALNVYDAADDLGRLGTPCALIWGEDDRLSSPASWRDFARSRPALRFCVVPQAGHVPMLEAPLAFNAVLRATLPHLVADADAGDAFPR